MKERSPNAATEAPCGVLRSGTWRLARFESRIFDSHSAPSAEGIAIDAARAAIELSARVDLYASNASVLIQRVHNAQVRNGGNAELCEILQHLVRIVRGREQLARLGEESRAAFRGTHCSAGEHKVFIAQDHEAEYVFSVSGNGKLRTEERHIDWWSRERIRRASGTVDFRADAREQSLGEIRFRSLTVRAARDTAHDCEWIVEAREQNDAQIAQLRICLDAARHFIAADVRHNHIAQHEIEVPVVDQFHRALACARNDHVVVFLLEQVSQRCCLSRAVFDDEDPLVHDTASTRYGAISGSASVVVTTPARAASRGIPYTIDVASSCATTSPPAA